MKSFGKYMLLSSLLGASLVLGNSQVDASSSSSNSVNVQLNDSLVNFKDASPFLDSNNKTQVPLRMLAEDMNYSVSANKEGSTTHVTIKQNGNTIKIQTGSTTATVNGKSVSIGTKVFIRDNRTYVPLRFVSEAMGSEVVWKQSYSLVMVNTTGKTYSPVLVEDEHAKGTSIVQEATKYIGTPYVYGGSSPSGFDCSGFVKYVFDKHDISLPRTAASMYNTGTSVAKSNLKQGDLVFFKTTGTSISHVGVYVGNNSFISATSSSGIKIDSLSNTYWGPKYVGAKKVL
ncbi:NlpC/P60 family protein [Paenibacillus sp. Marseille-Q4541]|uniref:C40 family peptidase n=1 Tax=Paenibacillus sp. Marseille-Q4541 TaxID=2831522 RepID=UPI001BABF434|nr:NlpC/P60 family protein [Paenibacillus sp. Marseille-Q4541]